MRAHIGLTVAIAVTGVASVFAATTPIGAGDSLRLEYTLNGRSSPEFAGTKNILVPLVSAGTQVQVIRTRSFASGARAVQAEIVSGPHKGKQVWLFQNRQGTYLRRLDSAPVAVKKIPDVAPPRPSPVPPPPLPLPDCPPEVTKPATPVELNPILNIASISQSSVAPKIACTPLKVGDSQSLNFDPAQSPTSVEIRYRLTRTSEKEYQVEVNPAFVDKRKDAQGSASIQDFRKRVQTCYDVASRALLGPDGKNLKLTLAPEGDPAVPKVEIGIYVGKTTLSGNRSNSGEYLEDIGCPAIVHETMHLLGLCDEYPESSMGKKVSADGKIEQPTDGSSAYKYDCRAVGPRESLMHFQDLAFDKALPNYRPFIYQCTCVNAKCRKGMDRWKPGASSCPKDAVMTERKHGKIEDWNLPSSITRVNEESMRIVENKNWVIRSLLHAGHFNAIVHPGCAINDDFYSCSAFAYKDATGPGRAGCGGGRPSVCTESDAWIGTELKPAP